MKFIRILLAALAVACPGVASAQAILQGGPWAPGHAPMYVGQGSTQPIVQDSGPAGGGTKGLGLNELLLTARGTGVPPFAAQGTGPLGTNFCDYDGPLDGANGYHYLCLSANAQGGGLISYGAGGAASELPLSMNINGQPYQFPFNTGGVVGPTPTVIGHLATWGNTVGTQLQDTNKTLPVGAIVGTTDIQTLTNKSISSDQITGTFPNATLAPMATATVKGNSTGSTASPSDLTVPQVAGMFSGYMPGWSSNVQSSGLPGLEGPTTTQFYFQDGTATFNPNPVIRAQRQGMVGGGTAGAVYPTIWGLTETSATGVGYEWDIVGQMDNYTSGTTGAQNVAVNGTINKRSNGISQIGPSWGADFVCNDMTTQADPSYSCIGAEIDNYYASATTDANRARVGLQIAMGPYPTSGVTGGHVGYGIFLTPVNGGIVDRGIAFYTGSYGLGIDTSKGTFSGAAMGVADNQQIAFDVNPTTGAYARYLRATGGFLDYTTPSGQTFQVSDHGSVWFQGHLTPFAGVIPVVSACGTSPAVRATSTDTAGEVTTGTGTPTSCTITFSTAYVTNAPFCVVTPQDGTVPVSYSVTTTALVITSAAASGKKIDWHCDGQ